jgi:exodeoxyribonuclease VII small subunit
MPDPSEPTFEEALTQLEGIVAELEHGEPGLSAALAKYENGVKLLRHCYQLLDQAERSVALLTGVDAQGNPLTTPFDSTATRAREIGPSPAPGILDPKTKTLDRRSLPKSRATSRTEDFESSDPTF